jgi:hypothetical protein
LFTKREESLICRNILSLFPKVSINVNVNCLSLMPIYDAKGTAGFQRTCFVIGIILLLSIPFSICVLRPTKHDRTKTEKYTPIFSLHDEGSFVIAA